MSKVKAIAALAAMASQAGEITGGVDMSFFEHLAISNKSPNDPTTTKKYVSKDKAKAKRKAAKKSKKANRK